MNDLRVSKTRQNIERSFFNLLAAKDISKITIKDICNEAQISRSTFYDHYVDLPKLIDTLEEKLVDKYVECTKLYHFDTDANDYVTGLFTAIRENRSLFSLLFHETYGARLQTMVIAKLGEIVLPAWKRESNLNDAELQIVYDYMMSGSMSILSKWYFDTIGVSEEQAIDFYINIGKFGVYNYIYTK